jgi:hypothetical protein
LAVEMRPETKEERHRKWVKPGGKKEPKTSGKM